jgi:hypothetical protein
MSTILEKGAPAIKHKTNSANFRATFFHRKSYVLIRQKMGWATVWVIFSQTHLVTLDYENINNKTTLAAG